MLTRTWTVETITGLPQEWSPDYRYRALARSTAPVAGATLLHTVSMGAVSVFVTGAATPPPAQWFNEAYAELRFRWSPDGSVPLLDPQIEDPGDLGKIQLRPTFFGVGLAAPPNVVTFTHPEPFSSTAMRKGVAGETPAVFAHLYVGDPSGAFTLARDTDVWVSGFVRGLWGH